MMFKAVSNKGRSLSLASAIALASAMSLAEPDVVESQAVVVNPPMTANNESSDGFLPQPVFIDESQPSASQINQQLAQEVMELRGIVEQLSYELELLKSQSKERYIDLDSRILDLYRQQGELEDNQQSNQSVANAPAAVAQVSISADEQALYDKARELMKNRDYDQAVVEFDQLTQLYPQSPLAANAWYWLGEIWLVRAKVSDAERAFATVLKDYPSSTKRADATYKLASVYEQTDRKAAAKQLYQKILEIFPNSNAARLAQRKLENL